MPGVARANVAVTDTFDVWRVRTNEINDSLNLGTNAITANTIIWRDDNSSFVANVVTANTVTVDHTTATVASISVTSTLEATAVLASIQTAGGIKADKTSRFGAGVTVVGTLAAEGNVDLGNAAGDTITVAGRFDSDLVPATNVNYDIGTSALQYDNTYSQRVILSANTTYTGGAALSVTSAHPTQNNASITNDALTTGSLMRMISNSADTTVRVLSKVKNDNVLAVGTTAFCVETDAGRGLYAISNLANGLPALEILSSHATTNAAIVTASSLTTGSAVQVTSAATARTGHLIHLASTDTGAGSTGDVLHVKASTSSNTAMIANFANSTTNVMSVMVGGGVKIDGNLDVTGSTTQFRTTSALVNDKTLVLGTVGEAVTGVTFSQHASTPVFTTTSAHSLSAGDVIFVTTSTSSIILSETLYTLATGSGSTFTLVGTIDTDADASSKTIVYTGPQLDSGVDDAGIYIPGSTALHTFKWDDDDNFFEVNDSFKVDTVTQLVVPVGTTAQRPAAASTATLPAAVVGAMRFNSDTTSFEGVNAGTSFEAFATQNFSTAIAVALG